MKINENGRRTNTGYKTLLPLQSPQVLQSNNKKTIGEEENIIRPNTSFKVNLFQQKDTGKQTKQRMNKHTKIKHTKDVTVLSLQFNEIQRHCQVCRLCITFKTLLFFLQNLTTGKWTRFKQNFLLSSVRFYKNKRINFWQHFISISEASHCTKHLHLSWIWPSDLFRFEINSKTDIF
jgi:hypothetical protein